MKNNVFKRKTNVIDFSIIVLCTLLIITIITISFKYLNRYKNEQQLNEFVEEFSKELDKKNIENTQKNNTIVTFKGYEVYGTLKIDKIGIEYPVLNTSENAALDISVIKFFEDTINGFGNITIAGHNNYDGSMFGKIKKLVLGDEIQVKDYNNNVIKYKITEKYITTPIDTKCTKATNYNTKQLTLITCYNFNKQRLVIKALQI